MRLKPGDAAPSFEVTDLAGVVHRLEDYRGKRLLLSFHRYAACPLCNLHIHELATEHGTLHAGGLSLLAIFKSGPERLADQYESRSVPFPIAADPEQKMYIAYGVESSVAGMLKAFVHPRAMKAFFSGFMPGKIDASTTTLPADFLIDEDLRIARVYYSDNITQHMPIAWMRDFSASGST